MNITQTNIKIHDLNAILINENGIQRNSYEFSILRDSLTNSITDMILHLEGTKCPAAVKEWSEVVMLAKHWLRHKVDVGNSLRDSWTYSSSQWMVVVTVEIIDYDSHY